MKGQAQFEGQVTVSRFVHKYAVGSSHEGTWFVGIVARTIPKDKQGWRLALAHSPMRVSKLLG